MKKHINKTILFMLVALIVVSASLIVMYTMQDSVAVEKAKEAYTLYMRENPASKDSDFIYIYEEHIVIAIRDGKVIRKEYVSESHAVKAATGNSKVLHYSLSSTNNNKLFIVKLFDKQSDIFAIGSQKLAAGANSLIIKVVSNGMIFANFEIPASAIADKNSPVDVTISKIDPEENVKLGANQEGFAYDIDVTNLVENNTSLIKVSMNGPKGLIKNGNDEAIKVYHKSAPISSTYEAKTGEVAFETTDFSPYTFVYDMVTVTTVEDLRYYLQREASGNIRLGQDLVINLNEWRDTKGQDSDNKAYYIQDEYKVYYARAPYGDSWQYFGALVVGDMTIDLNGFTITYNGSATNNDSALFAVGANSSLTIIDSTREDENKNVINGRIEVPYDQYAVWSVDYTSAVSIYGGTFATDEYVSSETTKYNKTLLYSSGGKINVYGGYYMYSAGDGSGGFNVINSIKEPRIWIYEGVHLSNNAYQDPFDTNSIILVGDAKLSDLDDDGWYTVQGQKLDVNVPYTKTMLYRVGNKNAFKLGVFFKELAGGLEGDIEINIVDIIKTDEAIKALKDNNTNKFDKESGYYKDIASVPLSGNGVDYTYTPKTDWTTGTIQFKGFTGPVRLELIDSKTGAVCASINLEVVDGYNMTQDAIFSPNATNKNVCMLSDLTLSGKNAIQVSGGYALYGNGFTIYDTRNTVTWYDETLKKEVDNTATKNGIVYINNGTVENVQIIGYQLTTAGKILNDNKGHAPAVYINNSGTIYNSYIYGGSSPIMTNSGTILLDNVILDGGGFCNMYVWGAANVTLKNCTTTKDSRNGAVGMGIVVGNSNAKITLEGSIKQYNWLQKSEMPSDYQNILSFLYSDTNYAYEGKYVNMGIFFIDAESGATGGYEYTTDVVWPGMLTDNTSTAYNANNPTILQYGLVEKAYVLTATAYIPKVGLCSADMLGTAPKYVPSRYHAYKPTLSYNNSANSNLTGTGMTGCTYENGAINVETKSDTVTLDLSGITLGRYGKSGSYDWSISPAAVSTSGKKVTLNTSTTTYTVTVRVAVSSCTPSGVRDDSVFEVYTYTLPINISKTVNPVPEWGTSTNTTPSKYFWITSGAGDIDYRDAMPLYNGLYVTFYDANGTKHENVNLSYQTDKPVISSDNSSAVVTFTSGDLAGCTLKIEAPFSGYGIDLACYDENSDTAERVYLYLSTARDTITEGDEKQYKPSKTLTYTFTDPNGQSTTSKVKVTYSFNAKDPSKQMSWSTFDNGGITPESPCVTPDTLITLADGTQVRVDSLKGDELLLVWNLETGKYEAAPIVFVDSDAEEEFEIIHLYFSDGSDVKVLGEHGFFDLDLGKYVYIDADNYADYIGHRFVTEGDIGENTWNVVTLDEVKIETEVTTAWSPVTFEHLCYYTNGVLSMPGGIEGLFNIFEVDTETMTYDKEQMQKDIETYGLFTFEDFDGMIPEMAFEAFNGQYLKVAIGKGLLTWEQIAALAERYVPLM